MVEVVAADLWVLGSVPQDAESDYQEPMGVATIALHIPCLPVNWRLRCLRAPWLGTVSASCRIKSRSSVADVRLYGSLLLGNGFPFPSRNRKRSARALRDDSDGNVWYACEDVRTAARDPHEPLAGFNSRRHLLFNSGAYRCTRREMLVWSAGTPRCVGYSSTSRYDNDNRRYQRTAHKTASGG